ncbi:hypothetical protein [Rheinheimera aquimaris]|uniref:hypothetical protein n=1 Tax=Rheinheimera aquimaris TaxID=412437 RepID=UPI001E591C73|nr:hypothetical protein [Rheinheimera aquimaris]MCD1597045.1 hypothetical protein [Rheinheimera aquimaris]
MSFSPLLADFGKLRQLQIGLLIFTPIIAYLILWGIDFLLSRYQIQISAKPLKVTTTKLFIPKWLLLNQDGQPAQDSIVDVKDLHRIVIQSYTVRTVHGNGDFIHAIHLQLCSRNISLNGSKLMFHGVIKENNELLKSLKTLPCEIVFEDKGDLGGVQAFRFMEQGRLGSTYTLLLSLVYVLSFGSLLRVLFW